jgi:hypothetical protein
MAKIKETYKGFKIEVREIKHLDINGFVSIDVRSFIDGKDVTDIATNLMGMTPERAFEEVKRYIDRFSAPEEAS